MLEVRVLDGVLGNAQNEIRTVVLASSNETELETHEHALGISISCDNHDGLSHLEFLLVNSSAALEQKRVLELDLDVQECPTSSSFSWVF